MTLASHRRASARVLSIIIALAACASAFAQGAGTPAIEGPKVAPFEFNGDLSKLPLSPSPFAAPKPYRPALRPQHALTIPSILPPPSLPTPSFVGGPRPPMPSPTVNVDGVSFTDTCGTAQCGGGWPPDTNGDVGPNHVILAVNTAYAIYNKSGALLAAFQEDTLFAGTGANACNGNSQGDPVALYDRDADRWILTQFAFGNSGPPFFDPTSPFLECVAVSKTGDPVNGGWWLYVLRMDPGGAGFPPVGALNDYPKFGAWSDCIYMSANEFDFSSHPASGSFLGVAFASLSRADLYSGAPLTWALGFDGTFQDFTMMPSHNLGSGVNAPAPGTPNYFVDSPFAPNAYGWFVRKFTPGNNCGAGGSLGPQTQVSQTAYPTIWFDGVTFDTNIVPQPNTSNKLDIVDDRVMQRNVYRKVGGAESLWLVHAVGQTSPTRMGLQWAQINVTGGTVVTTPVQQGIYAPSDGLYRFMPSIAADGQGNVAIGFSTSGPNSPDFPSIKYVGRLASDTLGALPQTEVTLVAGADSQTNSCGGAPCHRWGDYSAMSVDPTDDCTFWYINEYYPALAGPTGNWHTRIGSFKFPTCTSPLSGSARTFVSVNGNDANPCTATSACRTLAHALTVTTPGGEIQVLDSGGYGGLTIDRPITIAASDGVFAGVSVAAGDGITVNPGAFGPVVLRGLTINSTGGTRGIVQQSGTALYIENCVISNFTEGIHAQPANASALYVRDSSVYGNTQGISAGTTASGTLTLEIDRSSIAGNGTGVNVLQHGASGTIRQTFFTENSTGILVTPAAGNSGKLEIRKSTFDGNGGSGVSAGSAGATAMLNIASSTLTNNSVGITSINGGVVHVADSTITANATGLSASGGGTIVSFGNNRLVRNVVDGSFSSTIGLQ